MVKKKCVVYSSLKSGAFSRSAIYVAFVGLFLSKNDFCTTKWCTTFTHPLTLVGPMYVSPINVSGCVYVVHNNVVQSHQCEWLCKCYASITLLFCPFVCLYA
jgi:hypothetical protein